RHGGCKTEVWRDGVISGNGSASYPWRSASVAGTESVGSAGGRGRPRREFGGSSYSNGHGSAAGQRVVTKGCLPGLDTTPSDVARLEGYISVLIKREAPASCAHIPKSHNTSAAGVLVPEKAGCKLQPNEGLACCRR